MSNDVLRQIELNDDGFVVFSNLKWCRHVFVDRIYELALGSEEFVVVELVDELNCSSL